MITLRKLRREDLHCVAQLHLRAFRDSAMSALGGEAVRRYYLWLLEGPHDRVALGGFFGDQLVGFVFGGVFRGALTGFLHENRMYLARHIAMRPWLLGTPLIRDRLKLATRLLWHRRRRSPAPTSVPEPPSFGILAIATDPAYQKRGVGTALLSRCEDIARTRGFARMVLSVATDNERAIAFYLDHGWTKTPAGPHWRGTMERAP